jgi:hypothetical protein
MKRAPRFVELRKRINDLSAILESKLEIENRLRNEVEMLQGQVDLLKLQQTKSEYAILSLSESEKNEKMGSTRLVDEIQVRLKESQGYQQVGLDAA